jgi:hypothetical protein
MIGQHGGQPVLCKPPALSPLPADPMTTCVVHASCNQHHVVLNDVRVGCAGDDSGLSDGAMQGSGGRRQLPC